MKPRRFTNMKKKKDLIKKRNAGFTDVEWASIQKAAKKMSVPNGRYLAETHNFYQQK